MHIKVKAWPGAGKEHVRKLAGDRYEIFVREPAQEGAANKRIARLLAETLGVPVRMVRLISGFQRPNKIFEIIQQKEG